MTKINVLQHQKPDPVEQPKLEPIVILKYIQDSSLLKNAGHDDDEGSMDIMVSDWTHALLISLETNNGDYDIFMLYDDRNILDDGTITHGVVCLGHWNDGVVA